MLFNSIEFAVFLPLVFAIHWYAARWGTSKQNLLLLIASIVFYGWWDWRYLSLVLISAGVDFSAALALQGSAHQAKRNWLLALSLLINLGLLGFFKYHDFFAVSFAEAFTWLGQPIEARTLNLVLPVGISFYTFQTMSYTIDVYRRSMPATRDPIVFGAYVLFFPQLVAGPIERATNLIPQFERPRAFDPAKAADGMRQMLWGLFKKVAIADQCAPLVDQAFSGTEGVHASTLTLGAVLFALQIYGDFSGYSDIAIGCARLFGFELMRNFAYPYFSRDIAEFWRRWHISLNTWFRDYLYIPLGGSKGPPGRKIRNVLIIFLVSGFWHGANWTYVAWGGINAAFFLPILLSGRNRDHIGPVASGRVLPSMREALRMLATFSIAVFAFIFFRSASISDALNFIRGLFSISIMQAPGLLEWPLIVTLAIMLVTEWIQREHAHGLEISHLPRAARWCAYLALTFLVTGLSGEVVTFIYFQF